MSAKINFKVIPILLLLSVQCVQANEQELSNEACERVEAYRNQEQGDKAPQSICQFNPRSLQYWSCVEEKIGEGYKWSSASSQCSDIK